MATGRRRRGRGARIVLVALLGTVGLVAVVRRQRLEAATRDFHARYGPLEQSA